MSIDIEEIFPLLIAEQSAIVTLVGTRIRPRRMAQRDTFPAITYDRISGSPVRIHSGASGMKRAVFRLECWSKVSQEQARTINTLVQAIEVRSRHLGDWWVHGLRANQDGDTDETQLPVHGDDIAEYCSSTEFTVWYMRRS